MWKIEEKCKSEEFKNILKNLINKYQLNYRFKKKNINMNIL